MAETPPRLEETTAAAAAATPEVLANAELIGNDIDAGDAESVTEVAEILPAPSPATISPRPGSPAYAAYRRRKERGSMGESTEVEEGATASTKASSADSAPVRREAMGAPDTEVVPEPKAATSPEAKALEDLAVREGFSSPAELKEFLASVFDALADPRNPHHATAALELNKRRSAEFRKAYQEYAATRTAEVTAPKPEPAPAPDETAPKPKTPETPSETIARLEAENIRLHERVTELETRIGGLTTEITSLRTRIDELLARRPEPVPPPEPEPRPRLPRPEAGRRDDTEFGPENVPPHLAEYYRLTNAVAMAKVGKAMRILSEGMSVEGLAKEATRAFTLKAYNDAKAMFEDHGDYVNYLAKIDAHPEAAGPRGEDDDETSDLAAALKRRRAERTAEDDDGPIGSLDSDDLLGAALRRRRDERYGEAEPSERRRRTLRDRASRFLAPLAIAANLRRGPAEPVDPLAAALARRRLDREAAPGTVRARP